ncbi:hypothetical protein J6590_017131 [Homalodisca vitripennis]|nr:hypothetical protein J6590_017131 [Homalodisca vitripennis]
MYTYPLPQPSARRVSGLGLGGILEEPPLNTSEPPWELRLYPPVGHRQQTTSPPTLPGCEMDHLRLLSESCSLSGETSITSSVRMSKSDDGGEMTCFRVLAHRLARLRSDQLAVVG